MPAVADQKPTTGTRAIDDGVGVRVGFAAVVRSGPGAGVRVEASTRVAFGPVVADGCVGAQDSTMAAIAATPIHS